MTSAPVISATALLYSGRENPSWTLQSAPASALSRAIGAMPPIACPDRPPPPLGYAGIMLDIAGQSWNFHDGVAALAGQCFADAGNRIEITILQTGRHSIGAALTDRILAQLQTPPPE